jgi:hypothetical protein
MRIQTIVFLTLLGLFFGSCATKKMNETIARYYPYHEDFTNDSTDLVIVKPSKKLQAVTQTYYVKRVKNVVVPLLVFWHWNTLYKCELDIKQELEKLCSDIKADCFKYKLDSILPEQKLELTVEALPTSFAYQEKGYMIVYLYGYAYKFSKLGFPMLKENFVVTYKLYSKNNLAKEGTLIVNDTREGVGNVNLTDVKNIEAYLDVTRTHLFEAKKELITQLQNVIGQ